MLVWPYVNLLCKSQECKRKSNLVAMKKSCTNTFLALFDYRNKHLPTDHFIKKKGIKILYTCIYLF